MTRKYIKKNINAQQFLANPEENAYMIKSLLRSYVIFLENDNLEELKQTISYILFQNIQTLYKNNIFLNHNFTPKNVSGAVKSKMNMLNKYHSFIGEITGKIDYQNNKLQLQQNYNKLMNNQYDQQLNQELLIIKQLKKQAN